MVNLNFSVNFRVNFCEVYNSFNRLLYFIYCVPIGFFQMSTNIKVCVRVRPENEKERAKSQQPVVCVIDESLLIFDPVRDQAGE